MAIKRALTIDDEVDTRRNLRAGLSAAGWVVEEAASGLGGLERIHRLAAEGAGFNVVLSEAILPDFDSKLMLRALRAQYPRVPFIVLTSYAEEEHRAAMLKLAPLAYLAKPLELAGLIEELYKFDLSATTVEPAPVTTELPVRPYEAYAFLRLADRARAPEVFDRLSLLEDVRITNAVRGDFDVVLRLTAPAADALAAAMERVRRTEGANVIAMDRLEQPRLNPEVADFILHYKCVAAEDREQYVRVHETNAYLVIDIDRYQLERVYTSIMMTEGVISCQVSDGGSKLIVMMSGAVRPEVMRHVLRKIATMDGIRRVREAPVINIHE